VSKDASPQDAAFVYERASDVARGIAKTDAYVTSRRERKKVEMLSRI
jgi:uncharacterized protein (DUF427 family)